METVRAPVAWALALAVALAGCSGPPGLEQDDSGDASGGAGDGTDGGGAGGGTGLPGPERPERAAMLLSFGLEDCSGVEARVLLEPEAAQATLPEGYTVHQAEGPAGAAATASYAWMRCGGLRTPTAFVNDTAFGSVALRIEAPEDAPDAQEHWYRFRVLAQDDLLHDLWVAAGYDVSVGAYEDASQVASSPAGGLAPEDRDVRLGGYGARGLVTLEGSAPSVRVAHYTEAESGRLEWTGSHEASSLRSMAGSLDLPADDPLSGVPTAPGSPDGALSQRYLDAASWSGVDLWLRQATAP